MTKNLDSTFNDKIVSVFSSLKIQMLLCTTIVEKDKRCIIYSLNTLLYKTLEREKIYRKMQKKEKENRQNRII